MLSKFPVLRVPQLVLTEIINQIRLGDLIPLSLCSKKMFLLVQFHRTNMKEARLTLRYLNKEYEILCYGKIENVPMEISILAASKIEYRGKKKKDCETVKIGNQHVPILIDKVLVCLSTSRMDQVKGFQEITLYVSKLLKRDIRIVVVDEDSLWMMDWIKTVQTELYGAIIDSVTFFNEEQYAHALEKCEASFVMLSAKAPPSFEYKKEMPEREFLVVRDGSWITLENLFNMKTLCLDINQSKLTTADFNQFLKHWLKGGSPQLEYLKAGTSGNEEDLYKDLREQIVPIQKQRNFHFNKNSSGPARFNAGFEICQENGKRVTLYYNGNIFAMAVGDEFEEIISEE